MVTEKTPLPDAQASRPNVLDRGQVLNAVNSVAKTSNKRSVANRGAKQNHGSRAGKRRVLVVDDISDVTEMIALFLKHAGYEVTTANSANKALQIAAGRSFDLIISDIGMPEMNGYELAESLRNLSDYRTTPLIAVTGYTEYDDRGRSLRAGFDAHLTKPINPSQLLDLIGRQVPQRSRQTFHPALAGRPQQLTSFGRRLQP